MTVESDLREIGASWYTLFKGFGAANALAQIADADAIFRRYGAEYVQRRLAGGAPEVSENQYFQALLSRFGATASISAEQVAVGEAGYLGISPQHHAFGDIRTQVVAAVEQRTAPASPRPSGPASLRTRWILVAGALLAGLFILRRN